jgi:hypothetical protein
MLAGAIELGVAEMHRSKYQAGDWVVYRKPKHGNSPGRRARGISPSTRGEDYTYYVDKFWLVVDSLGDRVVVMTRRGKRHLVDAANHNLRRAGWWDVLVHRRRFPTLAGRQSAD